MAHKLKLRAAVVGGINTDICGEPSGRLIMRDSNPGAVTVRPGGVGRNIAHNLSLLGMEVSLVAALGDDDMGARLSRHCAEAGIDLSLSRIMTGCRSSTYLYITGENGDMELAINDMDICRGIDAEYLAPLLPELNRRDALVLDANMGAETLEYLCRNVSAPIYADAVSTVKALRLLPCMDRLRLIKPNAMEAEALTGEADPALAARALVAMGVQRVYVSLGEDGMIAAEGEKLIHLPTQTVKIVNTNGAGDAATAALVWADLHGLSPENSVRFAQHAAALTCMSELSNAPEIAEITEEYR